MIDASTHILPDMLEKGLRLVFCGTAAGTVSALRGHYYAHEQNKFWKTLHEVGLTPARLKPSQFRDLLSLRIGLTDIAKTSFGMDKELPRASLGRDACDALRRRILDYEPEILAFTSLTAGRRLLGGAAQFGEQSTTLGRTRLWLLPSPSPAAQWNWDVRWWKDLARQCGTLETKQQL